MTQQIESSDETQASSRGASDTEVETSLKDALKSLHQGRRAGRVHYRCSFCNKGQEEVRRLIAGPNQVYICDECIKLCNEIIDEKEEDLNPKEIEVFFRQLTQAEAIIRSICDALQQITQTVTLAKNSSVLLSELPGQLVQTVINTVNTATLQLDEMMKTVQVKNAVAKDTDSSSEVDSSN